MNTRERNRRAQQALRDRRKAAGLVQVALYIKPELKQRLKEYADALNRLEN